MVAARTAAGSPTPKWVVGLATVVGNAFLVLWSIIFGSICALTGWIPPRGNWVFQSARVWAWCVLLTSGVLIRRRFETPLARRDSYVFMSNHESLYDIPALLVTLPGQTRFLAKRSLFRLPIFGWGLKAGGFITIDRENLESARDSFSDAVARLRQGVSVLVYPEGTRSATGDLLPFKRGGFLLALKSGLPIVPVGVVGSRRVRAKGSYAIHPGRIHVVYGSPIETHGFGVSRRSELMERVRAEILRLSGRGEARPEEAADPAP